MDKCRILKEKKTTFCELWLGQCDCNKIDQLAIELIFFCSCVEFINFASEMCSWHKLLFTSILNVLLNQNTYSNLTTWMLQWRKSSSVYESAIFYEYSKNSNPNLLLT